MRIGIGLNFYEDFDSLRRLMTSLQCCAFDLILAIDGKYKEWPTALPNLSHRSCFDLLHSFLPQTPVKYIAAIDKTQNEKRQIYLDECEREGIDVLLVLDSDEYIVCEETDWNMFKRHLEHKIQTNPHYERDYRKIWCIACHMWDQWPHPNLDGQIQYIPRIIYRPWELRYAENHFTIRHKKTGAYHVFSGAPIIKGLTMANDHKLREKHYQETSTTYSKALLQWEKEGRCR